MNHVLTVRDIAIPILVIGGLLGIGGLCLFVIYLLNPFRSGH